MITLDPTQITYWFNALRDLPENERTRALDAFWAGQIDSKVWLVQELNKLQTTKPADVYIFGGWIGVLASIMLQSSTYHINKIRSIDIDPWCEPIADMMCKPHEMNGWRFKARTCDMSLYQYESTPNIVINTSTEHVTQELYDDWYNNIPDSTLVVAQGNDFFSCNEHIRCSDDLLEFKKQNHVTNPLFEGMLDTHMYRRFMCIWIK